MAQQATDEEVLQLAATEFPESVWWRPGRVRKAWFVLWKAGIIKDDQVEQRW